MSEESKAGSKRDRFQAVADLIIARLETGQAEGWRQPWLSLDGARNGATGRPYQGINALILGTDPRVIRSGDPRYYTFAQIIALDKARQTTDPTAARIVLRKGARGQHVLAWAPVPGRDASLRDPDGESVPKTILRLVDAHVVFHASDIDGLPAFDRERGKSWDVHSEADAILQASGVTILHQGGRASYSSATGAITLPARAAFRTAEDYYGTAFHELGHARFEPVMEKTRGRIKFGTEAYAREEVRVELAAAMVCDGLGLVRDGHRQAAGYIGSWIQAVRNDKYEVFRAASDAKRIAFDILTMSPNAEIRALAAVRVTQEPTEGMGKGRGDQASPHTPRLLPRSGGSGWHPEVDLTEYQEAPPALDGTRRWLSIGRDGVGGVTLIATGGDGGADKVVLAKAPHDEEGRWRLNPVPFRDNVGDVVGWRGGKVVTLDRGIATLPDWAREAAQEAAIPRSRLSAAFAIATAEPVTNGPPSGSLRATGASSLIAPV